MLTAPHHAHSAATPLAHSTLDVLITDLLAEYELRHVFRNTSDSPIEAVYSFPVPLDAAFCSMHATLAGETLCAQVQAARSAERRYDNAISDGDSAVLLEQLEPGMLCVNLGNLMPGEEGDIVLRFAAALGVADGSARFSLPLVHRPRYGRSRLDALVTPKHDFSVEHPLSAQIRIRGLLAHCPVQCSTAAVRFSRTPEESELQLQNALLDRDLVLNFDLGHATQAQAELVHDESPGSSHAEADCLAIVTTFAPLPAEASDAPRDIYLLLDGSGSMTGDAIAQSRKALLAVMQALGENDRIQVIPFGSSPHPMFRRPLRATARVKDALRLLAGTVDANLGGTEMGAALEHALTALQRLDGPPNQKIIILVTDGAVTAAELKAVTAKAIDSGVRIFSVAVGSSAGADVLAPLSQATAATLERAVPAEPIDAAVMRQFRRARHAPLAIDTDWGDPRVRPLPAGSVYPGDALTLIARCDGSHPPRELTLALRSPHTQQATHQTITFSTPHHHSAMRAWAGQQIHAHAHDDEKETLALRYGLITPQTKAVLVKERSVDSKARGLPQVTPVPHMLPEGMLTDSCLSAPSVGEYLDIPSLLRRPPGMVLQDRAPLLPADTSPVFTSSQKEAFAKVLADLLIADILRPHLYLITSRLAPEHQNVFVEWLKQVLYANRLTEKQRFDTLALLQKLLDENVLLALDDDQEAMLAARLARAAAKRMQHV